MENIIASTFKHRFHLSNHVLDKWIRLKLNLILKERHYFLIMMYGTSEIWCTGHRETKFNNFLIIQPIIKKIDMQGHNDSMKMIVKKNWANDCANMINNINHDWYESYSQQINLHVGMYVYYDYIKLVFFFSHKWLCKPDWHQSQLISIMFSNDKYQMWHDCTL